MKELLKPPPYWFYWHTNTNYDTAGSRIFVWATSKDVDVLTVENQNEDVNDWRQNHVTHNNYTDLANNGFKDFSPIPKIKSWKMLTPL